MCANVKLQSQTNEVHAFIIPERAVFGVSSNKKYSKVRRYSRKDTHAPSTAKNQMPRREKETVSLNRKIRGSERVLLRSSRSRENKKSPSHATTCSMPNRQYDWHGDIAPTRCGCDGATERTPNQDLLISTDRRAERRESERPAP